MSNSFRVACGLLLTIALLTCMLPINALQDLTTPDFTTTTPEPSTLEPDFTTPEATSYEATTLEATTSEPTTFEAINPDLGLTTPEATTPDLATPDATTPDLATPDATTPDLATPDATIREPTTPKATTPEPTTPEATTPEPTTPEATTLEPTTPEPTTPEATTPEPTTPEATTPEATTPEATTPEATTLEPTTPEPITREATTPEATTPEPTTPEPTTPEATTPEPTTPEATTPEVTTLEPTTPKTAPEVTTLKATTLETITTEVISASFLFQLRLVDVLDCEQWRNIDTIMKRTEMIQEIVRELNTRCQCNFEARFISSAGFQCFPASPNAVTFRARLSGSEQATASDIIQDLEAWITSGAAISVQALLLRADASCPVRISSFGEQECQIGDSSLSPSTSNTGTIVGAVVAVVLILVLVVIALPIAIVMMLRRKRNAATLNFQGTSQSHGNESILLRTLPPTGNEEQREPEEYMEPHIYDRISITAEYKAVRRVSPSIIVNSGFQAEDSEDISVAPNSAYEVCLVTSSNVPAEDDGSWLKASFVDNS